LSIRVTTGSVNRPPMELESVRAKRVPAASSGFSTPMSISSWAMVWSRVSWRSSPLR
jgi:hypothetical protein